MSGPMADRDSEYIPCFCALCVSRCGAIATVADGRFVALDADPEHPTPSVPMMVRHRSP